MYKPILKPVEASGHILEYKPREFGGEVSKQALDFMKEQESHHDVPFRINPQLAESTGLGELERKKFNDIVEAKVIERLKAVEEKAYSEAYSLGTEDGRKKAFEDASQQIKDSIANLGELFGKLSQVKKNLFVENEQHLIHTVLYLAKGLILKEIKTDPSVITGVLSKALENAHSEEEITIKMNPEDHAFVKTVEATAGNPFEKVPKYKIEEVATISRGGCIVETNYGVIDAQIETRVEKLLGLLDGKTPKVESDPAS